MNFLLSTVKPGLFELVGNKYHALKYSVPNNLIFQYVLTWYEVS